MNNPKTQKSLKMGCDCKKKKQKPKASHKELDKRLESLSKKLAFLEQKLDLELQESLYFKDVQ